MNPSPHRQRHRDGDRRRRPREVAVCERCGPHLELLDREGKRLVTFAEALSQAAFGILRGEIVGVCGFGQTHYLADARNDGTISRLRLVLGSPAAPLPLMYADSGRAAVDFGISEFELNLLTAPDVGPVRLERKHSAAATPLAPTIAGPAAAWFPVMLARNRLHRLLLSQLDGPVVAADCRSAGRSRRAAATKARRGRPGGPAAGPADFILRLTCPAWVPEEFSELPTTRCALARWPERGGPTLAARRRPC